MKVEVTPEVLRFLREKGADDVTLEVEDIPSNCCLGRLPEMKITYQPPPEPDRYRHFDVQGIHLHLSRTLRTRETLTLSLSGLGPFKKIEVAGINLIL